MRRRNPDEVLRKLEREYLANGGVELRSKINAARLRAGLKLLPPTYRLFEFGHENIYQMQSSLPGLTVSSAGTRHDGWYGVDHGAWAETGIDNFINLGTHVTSTHYENLVKPTHLQVIKAHLEVLAAIETKGLSSINQYHRWGDFAEGHEVDISVYDMSQSPLRALLLCQACTEEGRTRAGEIYCDGHNITVCRYHGPSCEDECDQVECPQCARKCDVCNQPACSWHIRECHYGCLVCTNESAHCWDHCENCGLRICKNHANLHPHYPGSPGADWYCDECDPD